ncbi:MAG: phage tail tip lysozyme, partial [bacterium]
MKRIFSLLLALLLLAGLSPALAAGTRAENEETIFLWLTEHMGLTPAAASGVLASLGPESGFSPTAASRTAYGICQWTGTRQTNLKNWCKEHNLDYRTLDGQLRFMEHELNDLSYFKSFREKFYAIENTAEGAYQAGYSWCATFEGAKSYAAGRGISARDTYWPKYADRAAQPAEEEPPADDVPALLSKVERSGATATLTANAQVAGLALLFEARDVAGALVDVRLVLLSEGEQTLTFEELPAETAA